MGWDTGLCSTRESIRNRGTEWDMELCDTGALHGDKGLPRVFGGAQDLVTL